MGVSATRPWLARLGVLLVSVWMLAALFVFGFCGFFIGVCMYAHLDNYTTDSSRNNIGVVYRVLFVPPPDPNSIENYLIYREPYWKYFAMWDAILSLGMGMFAAVAMWHLPRRRFPLLQSYAVLIGIFVMMIWWASYNIDAIFLWSIERVTAYVVLSIAMLTLGQQIGRPVARFAVKTIIPPKLRQHVNFLWLCDGKTPPALPKP